MPSAQRPLPKLRAAITCSLRAARRLRRVENGLANGATPVALETPQAARPPGTATAARQLLELVRRPSSHAIRRTPESPMPLTLWFQARSPELLLDLLLATHRCQR